MPAKPPPLPPATLPQRLPAPFWLRGLAFVMDVTLVLAFGMMLLHVYLLPENHAGGYAKLQELFGDYQAEVAEAFEHDQPPPEVPDFLEYPEVMEALSYMNAVLMMCLWSYFTFCPVLMRGATLGKRTFSLRVVELAGQGPCPLWKYGFRASLQSIALLVLSPLLWLSFFWAGFDRLRRAGHDFACRTQVVQGAEPVPGIPERYAPVNKS